MKTWNLLEYLFEFTSVFSSVTLSKGLLERNPVLLILDFYFLWFGASDYYLFFGLLLFSFDGDFSRVDFIFRDIPPPLLINLGNIELTWSFYSLTTTIDDFYDNDLDWSPLFIILNIFKERSVEEPILLSFRFLSCCSTLIYSIFKI